MAEVGEALMISLKRDVDGSCYGVFPNCPLMDLPNSNTAIFYAYAFLGKTFGSALNMEVIGPMHLGIAVIVCLLIFALLTKVLGLL